MMAKARSVFHAGGWGGAAITDLYLSAGPKKQAPAPSASRPIARLVQSARAILRMAPAERLCIDSGIAAGEEPAAPSERNLHGREQAHQRRVRRAAARAGRHHAVRRAGARAVNRGV